MTRLHVELKKIILVLAGGAAAAFLLLLYINAGVLMHAGSVGADQTGGNMEVTLSDEDGSAEIIFSKEGGVYIHKLAFGLEPDGERPAEVNVSVYCLEGPDEVCYVYNDLNPVFVGTETILIEKDRVSRIVITGNGFAIGYCSIDNRPSLNWYVIIFGVSAGMALAALIVYRGALMRHPEYAFLMLALSIGLPMLAGLPRTKVGYDEETHLQAVFAIAAFPSGELHVDYDALNQLTVTEYNNPEALPGTAEESRELDMVLADSCDYKTGENTPVFSIIANRVPAYLPMAAALKAGKLISADWPVLIILIRLADLAVYVLLMFFALRLLPAGKPLMMLIALLPQNIFMAVTCSYDPFITGCMSLGYAFMLRGKRYALPMLICMVLACLPKAVYAPVILMGAGIMYAPEAASLVGRMRKTRAVDDPEKNNRTNTLYRLSGAIAGVIIFLCIIAVFILPTILAPEDTGDVRGGAVSMMGQVGFILAHPVRYTGILLSNMGETLVQFWFGADSMTFMGHVLNGSSEFRGYVGGYRLLLAAVVLLSWIHTAGGAREQGGGEAVSLNIRSRLWMVLTAFASAVLVWTAMYVAFTEPGALHIGGVQGRYFIPLMFPVYMALSGCTAPQHRDDQVNGKLERAVSICYYLVVLSELMLGALTVWTAVISKYCI